jgi:hypothetical protein
MNGYDAVSHSLSWDLEKSGSPADLMCLLRKHASTLRYLHVECVFHSPSRSSSFFLFLFLSSLSSLSPLYF